MWTVEGTEKDDPEDGSVTRPRGKHKRAVIDGAKEGTKLIGATEEKSFRWSELIGCGDPSGEESKVGQDACMMCRASSPA